MTSNDANQGENQRGTRPAVIANCSGSMGDSGYQMLRQMTLGDVDYVTGDYLAELNMSQNAEAFAAGKHPGYEPTAWDGLQQSMETIASKHIKVIINGGALNPVGLAQKCQDLIREKGYSVKVAAVVGDDIIDQVRQDLGLEHNSDEGAATQKLRYLDSRKSHVREPKRLHAYLNPKLHPIVSAHAYLGSRGIYEALCKGADIVVCGRVADAAPVMGAARHWFGWADTDYHQLAGSLIAGHLIECSAYVTGANVAGFEKIHPIEQLFDLPFGICHIDNDGSSVITKHENTTGMVTETTVKSQLLYEIQGNTYLNSDVKAYLDGVTVKEIGPNRVSVSGVRGGPPPATTKVAVAYKGGYQAQLLLNLGGYAVEEKHAFYEKQIRHGLEKHHLVEKFDTLEFQCIGTAAPNANTMLAGTTYLRVFSQAPTPEPIGGLLRVFVDNGMQHVSGAHGSTDFRCAMPIPYLSYFPAIYQQSLLQEKALILGPDGEVALTVDAGHPPTYSSESEEEATVVAAESVEKGTTLDFGPTRAVPLGDVALGRSGDKGSNVNLGLFVLNPECYSWFRAEMTVDRIKQLMGDDWREDSYSIERVEFPNLLAVHFVIYGLLGRGVSSTSSLDSLGKGFADWIRSRWCNVPEKFLI
ncbi:hypothetical protein GQX73_g1376 [Xylaria multiplex]|uniref:Uncharacterized protein n=1 Tax=Xylaria multiplex TaxID=323545 RepID=A0A7C8IVW8_9PEZI|nr:hypothetical protein GQX73_g1376 [Xylaria multiplex]